MDRRSRLLARLFAVSGVLLVPWVWVLIEQLHQVGRPARGRRPAR
jgi:hypothetical protein